MFVVVEIFRDILLNFDNMLFSLDSCPSSVTEPISGMKIKSPDTTTNWYPLFCYKHIANVMHLNFF